MEAGSRDVWSIEEILALLETAHAA
jgi:hypothetical protein